MKQKYNKMRQNEKTNKHIPYSWSPLRIDISRPKRLQRYHPFEHPSCSGPRGTCMPIFKSTPQRDGQTKKCNANH